MQQSYYGADIGEFNPDQLRKLAELREIENLQFNPIVIVKLENMGYQVDIETGIFYTDDGVSRLPIAHIDNLPPHPKTVPLVLVDPRQQMPEPETLIGFAVENRNGEIVHCSGMYDFLVADMWSDFSSPTLSDHDGSSYITASVLWWWTLPELPPHTPAEMV